jgi:hypothetical protein
MIEQTNLERKSEEKVVWQYRHNLAIENGLVLPPQKSDKIDLHPRTGSSSSWGRRGRGS